MLPSTGGCHRSPYRLNRLVTAANDAVTGTELLADGILDLPANRWTTELFDLLPYSDKSCPDPRSDHRPFQLGKHRGRLHNRLPPA
jgi:hypothetical protein